MTAEHSTTTLTDASGVGAKTWNFLVSGGGVPAWEGGLTSEFVQKTSASGTVYTDDTYTWALTPTTGSVTNQHPYIATKVSVTDPGGANPQSAMTTQTLDAYGNTTQSQIFPYNNATTAVKTYTSTFLTDATYLGNYLRDRLLTTTLLTGGATKTLVQNYYDGENVGQSGAYPCSNGGNGYIASASPQYQIDANPPVSNTAGRGWVTASVNPAKTSCNNYYTYGSVSQATGSDGSRISASADSSTNYAAP